MFETKRGAKGATLYFFKFNVIIRIRRNSTKEENMFDDAHVLSAQPPPNDLWKVMVKGHHQQDVAAFAKEVANIFADLNPVISAAEKLADDQIQMIVQMKWNSIALERMLEQMVPNHLEIKQHREANKCQGQII